MLCKSQQRPGVRVRQPASSNRQPAAATEPQPVEPPSPASSTSSSQLQKEVIEELDSSQVQKAAPPVATLSTQKSIPSIAALTTQKSVPSLETTSQSVPAEEEPMQIEEAPSSSSTPANENGNPPTKDTMMEESIRVTRGRLRKTRPSSGSR